MAEEAKAAIERALVVAEAYTAPARHLSVDEMNPAELLATSAVLGLRRLHDILNRDLPDDMESKAARFVGDMALGVNKLFMRAAEAEFRAKRGDNLGKLLEMLREATEKK